MKTNLILLLGFLLAAFPAFSDKKGDAKNVVAAGISASDQVRFDYYFFEAQRLKNIQQYDAQLEALRMCLEIDSTNAAAQSEIGYVYARMNRMPETLAAFRKAVEKEPMNWWYRTQYISVLSNREQYATAIEQAEQLKKLYPEREEVYRMLSALYKQNGDIDKSIEALNQLEAYTGISEELSLEKFQLYSMLKKDKEAMAEIERLTLKFPQDSHYRLLLGDVYLDQNQPEKAFEIYTQVQNEEPDNPYVYLSLSNYYKAKKQPDKALDAIMSALKNPKLPSDSKMDILAQYVDQLLADNQKIDETESLFKLLIDMYPLEEMPHFYYAMFLHNQKRSNEALDQLESVININSKNEEAWKSSLQIIAEKNDTVGMLKLTERAIKELPKVPDFYYFRSIAFYQQKKYQEALNTDKQALENIADSSSGIVISNFYGQMGDIYFQLKDKENAYASYDKALEANPNNVYVMNNYAYYLSEEGTDLRKAERMSAKTVNAEPNNSTYLDTYAWIFYKQGNYNLAKIYITKAVDNVKETEGSEVILEHAGDIYAAVNENDKALEMWTKALNINDKNDALKAKIEKLKKTIEK